MTLKGMDRSGMGSGTTAPPPVAPLAPGGPPHPPTAPLYCCWGLQPLAADRRRSSGGWAVAPSAALPLLLAGCGEPASKLLALAQAGGSSVATAGGTSMPRDASGGRSNTPTNATL